MTPPPKVAHLKCTAKTKECRFILQCCRGWERTGAMQSVPETAHLLIALPSTLTRMAPTFGHILTIRVKDLGTTGQQFPLEQKMQPRTSPAECCYSTAIRLLLMMTMSPIPPKVTMMSVASGNWFNPVSTSRQWDYQKFAEGSCMKPIWLVAMPLLKVEASKILAVMLPYHTSQEYTLFPLSHFRKM